MKKSKKPKITKKHQSKGKRKTDWIFWLEIIQSAIAFYNTFLN